MSLFNKLILIKSETKFNSHCGWPAFYAGAKGEQNIQRHEDRSHGMVRVEVTCKKVISIFFLN
jgi:peptide-methionine (R)-S-oxide reductase